MSIAKTTHAIVGMTSIVIFVIDNDNSCDRIEAGEKQR
jgi:hypothetical protein